MTGVVNFDSAFAVLTGNAPFPWQRALFDRFVAGEFPKACDLPTGLGKTSVIALWLLALAENPALPRRLVYVVNRRTVVDQSTTEAENLRKALEKPEAAALKEALLDLAGVPGQAPIAISTLRGEFADNAEWRRDPARPAIIVGTVDMIGSRLLFNGYGCGFKTKPLHAGLLGQDSLLMHDEAHLEPAFQELLESLRAGQFKDLRAFHVMALSATGRVVPDFTMASSDEAHPVVRARITAKKGLSLHDVADKKELAGRAAELALQHSGAVLVFLSTVENVERCAAALRKEAGKDHVQVLTGTMRGDERDALARTDPVFARFQPEKSRKVSPREGTVFLVCTSAGEVGIDLSADHLVMDLPAFDALAQRLGRVNRYGAGDARVDVIAEPLEARPTQKANDEGHDEDGADDDKPAKRKDELDWARHATRELLAALPARADELRDASPAALRSLPSDARLAASTPLPDIPAVDELLFDRWSYTSIRGKLPGRPPVDDWLHGVAEWEPPRTTIAWRTEVAWLDDEHLGAESLDDFLADYPLRARERLSDRTDRVLEQLEKIIARDEHRELRAWLLRDGEIVRHENRSWWRLADLVDAYDSKRNPLLDEVTVILPPEAGGLNGGLLDGDAVFEPGQHGTYDRGPREGERLVHELAGEVNPPEGMRLARAIRRQTEEGEDVWWQLYTLSLAADDDGSRTSRFRQTLDFHLRRAEHWAEAITSGLEITGLERSAIVRAARWHDLGKRRRVWQRSIKNFDYPTSVFAKGKMQPSELGHYRHELGSLHDALNEPGFADLAEDERELALHLIAAHHGRARPHFPPEEAIDPEVKDAEVAAIAREVPLRFERLQRKYGRWGLAWLESLVRAADYLASDDEEVES
ncbi:MAG: type I-U CRISPR-associated helicase/endonuclease Cas3 [Myxococcales bacterium]|nr:type I-U CRISPR-associated helicase/endonuclease Cas3 [Myxococcales bacterium]